MKIENKIKCKMGILSALAVISGIRLFALEAEKLAVSNSIITVFIWIAIWYILLKAYERIRWENKRETVIAACFSFFLSTALCWGADLEKGDGIAYGDVWQYVTILIWTILFTIMTKLVFHILDTYDRSQNGEHAKLANGYHKKQWITVYLGLIVCWMPVFLAVYPGFFVYDAQDELNEVLTRTFTNHHPLTHVLLLGGVIAAVHKVTDSYNLGIAVYMLLQMLFMAGCFTYAISFMKKHGVKKWVRIIAFLWFAFFPVIPMYVFCSTKDSLFTAILLVQLLLFYEFVQEGADFVKDKKRSILLVLFSVGMMLFRHNGFYAYAVCVVIWFAFMAWKCNRQRKNENEENEKLSETTGALEEEEAEKALFDLSTRKRIFVICIPLLVYFLLHKALIFGFHAESNEYQEMLTVPIMQLTRVYERQPEDFTEEQKQRLFSFLPETAMEHYNEKLSDPVKAEFNNGQYHLFSKDFWKLWYEIGKTHIGGYLNAWFYTSYGLWYPDTVIDAYEGIQRYTFRYGDSSFFGYETEEPGVRNSKILWLNDLYRQLSLEITQQKIPIISMLFSPGFLCWCYLFAGCYLFRNRNWNWLFPIGLILLLWLTVLLGPTSMVRYVLIFWFFFPILCSMIGGKITGWRD